MAEIAVTIVINKAIDIASKLVLETGYHLHRLSENIRWIERQMRHIQSFLIDAEAKQVGNRGVANMIIDIRDLAYDVEDILDKFLPEITSRKRKGFFAYLKSAVFFFHDAYIAQKFAMEIKKIERRVEDIKNARETYGITDGGGSVGRDTRDPRQHMLHVDEPNTVGFDKDIRVLKIKLLNTDSQCGGISIVGMPGLGKTTLAKKVFKSVHHRFECSAVVHVSQNPNIRELLRDIARQVGLEKDKREEINVETNLLEFLRGKRYVIFLDDIWYTRTWDDMQGGIPTSSLNGSRIILTSRNSSVGRYVGGESSLHELQPLDPENSWRLFSKMIMAPLENSDKVCVPPELEDIGRQIVGKCGGVPLAIVVTAGMLREKERKRHEWSGVLKSMGQDTNILRTLALSYKDLPPDLKPCFLYFGLFPEDHEVSAFELINLWVAERFIKGSREREVEEVGEDYLSNLVARNLIQVVSRRFDGRIRICRIHDLVRDLCISVAAENNFFSTHDAITSNSARRVRRVTTHGSSISKYISLNYQTSSSRAFICFDRDQTIQKQHLKSILGDFNFLRVLIVECLFFPSDLPKEIGNLSHLSYLRLSGTGLHRLPSTIENLTNLLTLDVQECRYVSLPAAIWKMKQLRHIVSAKPPSPPDSLLREKWPNNIEVSLPNLQTLFVVPGDCLNPCWLHKFTNLRKLGITFSEGLCDRMEQIVDVLSATMPVLQKLENLLLMWSDLVDPVALGLNLSRYKNLYKLHLEGAMIYLPNPDRFPPNLTKLTLVKTQIEADPMEVLKELPKLKVLKFVFHSYKGTRMDCSGDGNFPQLRVLHLSHLMWLKQIIADHGGMPALEKLIIRECTLLQINSQRLKWIWLLSV